MKENNKLIPYMPHNSFGVEQQGLKCDRRVKKIKGGERK